MSKRGQVTIFIIIAIVIVAAAVVIYLFWPKIKTTFVQTSDPKGFIEDCLNPELKKNVELISKQGGSLNPTSSVMYKNDKVSYLCYTSDYYLNCYMQKPLLKQNIEEEIKNSIKSKVDSCFQDLKNDLENRGMTVTVSEKDFDVELFPGRIRTAINYEIVTTSSGTTNNYKNFNVDLKSNEYDLVSVATSIANWEARYGDAEVTIYMAYYPNIKVEKNKLNDGSKVYVITDRNTKEEFKFASRSGVLPAGYAANQIQ